MNIQTLSLSYNVVVSIKSPKWSISVIVIVVSILEVSEVVDFLSLSYSCINKVSEVVDIFCHCHNTISHHFIPEEFECISYLCMPPS